MEILPGIWLLTFNRCRCIALKAKHGAKMIYKLLKSDSVIACFMSALIGLIAYILITLVSYGREITQIQTQLNGSDSFTAQQLNRIEANQVALIHNFDDFKQLVLRNIKITNG